MKFGDGITWMVVVVGILGAPGKLCYFLVLKYVVQYGTSSVLNKVHPQEICRRSLFYYQNFKLLNLRQAVAKACCVLTKIFWMF